MTPHLVNLNHLFEAASLLMGPEGPVKLATIYAALERVGKERYEEGVEDGEVTGYEEGYIAGVKGEQESADRERREDDVITINEEAYGHDDHYDIYHGRFHRDGGDE
jgi:hypothetical protein